MELSPLEGVEVATGMKPERPPPPAPEGVVRVVGEVIAFWDSHWPTLNIILGDIPGNFFLPAGRKIKILIIGFQTGGYHASYTVRYSGVVQPIGSCPRCTLSNIELLDGFQGKQSYENILITATPALCLSTLKETRAMSIQGFAESLQQECSKLAQNVMIELYCCGPGLLFWLLLFQIRKGLGSWVFKVLLQRFCKTL